MSPNQPDFFDVLPYHPPPEPFESMTGYLARLAQGNGIKSVRALWAMCFADRCEERPLPRNPDFSLKSWEALPLVTTRSESDLLATTFYYLIQKFGRSIHHKSMTRFLKNCLSDGLRYCPLCLREAAFYRLTWRFLTLRGCIKHGCRLLDRCGHCGQSIPFLVTPLVVGICPHCRGDLSDCQTDPFPKQARQTTLEHLHDLQFLLAPEPSPLMDTNIIRAIGLRFAYLRLEKGIAVVDVTPQVGLPNTALHAMEGRGCGGVTFFRYVQYAAYLGVTLRQVFNTVLPPEINEYNWRQWSRSVPWREQTWVSRVQAAIKQLEAEGKPVCQQAICQALGCDQFILRQFPQVMAILEKFTADQKAHQSQRQEEELLSQVQAATDQLKTEGKPITQRAICRLLGLPRGIVDRPSRAGTVIKQAVTEAYLTRQQHLQQRQKSLQSVPIIPEESKVVRAVQQAIEQLKQAERPVTIKAICRITGLSTKKLRSYPHVDLMLDQIVIDRYLKRQSQQKARRQREEELVQATQAAVAQLEAHNQLITQRAVGQIVGLSHTALSRYPRIKAIFNTFPQKQAIFRQKQRQQRERQLISSVQAAIRELELHNQSLSQENIARQVGVSISRLYRSQQIQEIWKQVEEDRRRDRIAQTQQ
jgi:hypothetical protein